MVRTSACLRHVLASVVTVALAGPTLAAGSYTGSIAGLWTDPVLAGITVDGATGVSHYADDSATVVCNLAGCPVALPGDPSSLVTWGDGTWDISHSVVRFEGASFANVAPGDVFELGRLTYTNGTSWLGTVLYGATLTLQAVDGGGAAISDPLAVQLQIVTTGNTGTDAQNADFLSFDPATFGQVQPVSFNVLEGATATAILYGAIVGDPQLLPDSIVIAPGSETTGFIGTGLPAVPEPGQLALLLAGLPLLALAARRKR